MKCASWRAALAVALFVGASVGCAVPIEWGPQDVATTMDQVPSSTP